MFDDLQNEELESELCSQAAHVTAGECHLVLLIGEFDRREAWGGYGVTSCAHFLNWRVGTSFGAAREQVRVGRALEQLPHVRAAFASGELSYSKVRAITRVADPQLEEHLVELGRHATASQLEGIVRAYRRADPEEVKKAEARHGRRYLRHYTDDEGMVVIKARLSREDGAVVLAALELARQALSAQPDDVSAETPAVPADVSAETPDGREYANPWSKEARAAELRHDLPLDGREVTAADAFVGVCASVLSRGLTDDAEDPHVSVLVHVDEQVLDDPTAPGCAHIEGLGSITGHAAARLACEGTVSRLLYRPDGSVEPQGATRSIPPAMRRALRARDQGCRFPGCTARRFLHAHHVVFWSKGGPTALSNLVLVCGAHHRLVHEGGWRLALEPSGRLRVFSPEGTELPAVGKPTPATGEGLRAAHRRRGLPIGPDSLAFGGERFDLGMTIDGLLAIAAGAPSA